MLKGKNIVVIGGAGLLGKEFCREILSCGANLVIADYDKDQLKIVKDNYKADVLIKTVNITDPLSISSLISYTRDTLGSIDAVVNTAYPRNSNYGKHFFDVEINDFNENINLNLGGYFLVMQKFAHYMKEQGYGHIISLSSIYGVMAPKFEVYNNTDMTMPVEYAVIKSGLIHLTKYLAKYLKGTNVRVNCLSPGGILNGQNKKFIEAYNKSSLNKGMLDKNDISGSLIYLLSDASKYVNGHNLIVDDGFTL